MCLKDSPAWPRAQAASWHCTNTGGQWGATDHTFGPGHTFDLTMMGGSPTHPEPGYPDLNETFTVHGTNATAYGTCEPTGPVQWTVTRELSYLEGTAVGLCQTRILESGIALGTFLHNCTTMTQITLEADEDGAAKCGGCRCCTSCDPPSLCLPP